MKTVYKVNKLTGEYETVSNVAYWGSNYYETVTRAKIYATEDEFVTDVEPVTEQEELL